MTKSIALNYHVVQVSGDDSESFLSGQLTSDVQKLKNKWAQHSARLNVNGQVKSFFHLGKNDKDYYLVVSEVFSKELREDLEKYVIAEDVTFSLVSESCTFLFDKGFTKYCKSESKYLLSELFATFGCFVWNNQNIISNETDALKPQDREQMRLLSGYPDISCFEPEKVLINNLVLNELAISYEKGCFLGQEPVAKVQNNRGASHYPMAFILENNKEIKNIEFAKPVYFQKKKVGTVLGERKGEKHFISLSLLRDYRVNGREYDFQIEDDQFIGKVMPFPVEGFFELSDFINDQYLKSLSNYNNLNIVDDSILYLEDLYFLDPSNKDVCESLGAILGNCSRYKEAISYMDHLEAIDPNYGMANTNKSVYYMKIGEIEKAEQEKEQALLKSFKHFGKESDDKEKEKKFQEEEILKREKRKKMFIQVLQLDSDDTVANYGLANILFIEEELGEALSHVEKVVEKDKKYSVAYLLMGKILEKSGRSIEAKKVYESGIVIASQNGDLQPANEMQYRVNQLSI